MHHASTSRSLNIIKQECLELENDEIMYMAINSICDAVRADGLTPTLIGSCAMPNLGLFPDNFKATFQRTTALRIATAEMSKHFANNKFAMPFVHKINQMLRTFLSSNSIIQMIWCTTRKILMRRSVFSYAIERLWCDCSDFEKGTNASEHGSKTLPQPLFRVWQEDWRSYVARTRFPQTYIQNNCTAGGPFQ